MLEQIRGCRYVDTVTNKEKTLIKMMGDLLYFSDGDEVTVEVFNKRYRLKGADEN